MRRPPKQFVTHEQLAIRSGDAVFVRRDDGSIQTSTATSEPWLLDHGVWIIKVAGISGGYDLERVTKANYHRK